MGQDYYGIDRPSQRGNAGPNGVNKIVNGVEVDKDGAVEAYWISNKVPYDPVEINRATNWTRIEAFGQLVGKPNVLHICHDERPEQYRGVPYLAPVLTALKQVSRYADAGACGCYYALFLYTVLYLYR